MKINNNENGMSKYTITGAEALMLALKEEGVKTIFGYPGGSIMPVYDALYDYTRGEKKAFDHILVRHEQAAAHAAEGYARVSDEVGVCIVTSGPGATNTLTGVADAMMDSTPIVVIAGQVGTGALGTDAFQEVDLVGVAQPITKWAYQIRRPEDVAWAISRAFYIARSGRPGPVVLDFPKNAQVHSCEWKPVHVDHIRSYNPYPQINQQAVADAADIINAAERPFALVGQGVELGGAHNELVEFLEKADIPAGRTLLGLSALPSGHPLNMGMLGMHGSYATNMKTQECDVLIAIGMRFSDRVTGLPSTYAKQAKIIHLDIDPAEINKNIVSDVAKEGVITNTNLIADMIEKISPVRPDKQPPIIEKSDETLTNICYDKAHQIYGPNLPDIVEKRLKKELNSIISNGFAVMYIIAQKLVWKSNDDGYLVGSRGSVGSSFVATMAGITEVNPLPAHYICPHCYFTDFDSDFVKQYEGQSGCDMPDRECPKCGTMLNKEGHDIPFETFLGFNGDKEPDIDLNFSGEYQPRAHAYTEELFGKGKAFRAGTIGTLADKTAFGYVYNYFKERGIEKRRCEMERIAAGCTGVKRTSGQHPGGMIVLPKHEEIYSFTPIQKPANDMSTDVITTHFEYHSIDHNLLKLDILGHDDPTMIRRLEDLTGVDAKTIPLDDAKVMSLFHNTEALGIEPKDIGGTRLGTLGIPEFGTEFAMQMLIDAGPKSFSDLARIAGLSHGTDVWLGNAQTLIQEGKCELSSAICTRDDIMTYLIYRGLEPGTAFKIMENVRKGNVAKGKCDKWEEWKQDMKAHNVPDWYIWSCEKIKYMFPKAHAVAYVMMGWRIAYFKIYYPLAYYTAFFSIRATAFDYKLMCQGKEALEENMRELQKTDKDKLSATDKNTLRDMKIVQEMYARGIEFLPIDLYRSDATRFQIVDGKILPSFASIGGLGESAAKQLQEAAKQGPFTSKEDIRSRGKVSKTILDEMESLGILGDIPETNQYDFFSMLK